VFGVEIFYDIIVLINCLCICVCEYMFFFIFLYDESNVEEVVVKVMDSILYFN
jgi:hypothetical protein